MLKLELTSTIYKNTLMFLFISLISQPKGTVNEGGGGGGGTDPNSSSYFVLISKGKNIIENAVNSSKKAINF